MYIVVRKDLPIEQQLVQACHASIEMSAHYLGRLSDHPVVVAVVVKDEKKLKQVARRLKDGGVKFRGFYEPDLGNQMTALATKPLYGIEREFFEQFQLFRGSYNKAPQRDADWLSATL